MNENLPLDQPAGNSPTGVAIRYGFFTSFLSVVYSLLLFVTGWNVTNQALTWISFLILGAGIFLAHNYFKSSGNGYMRYGQGIGIGSLLALVVGLISGIFTYVYVKFVDSGFMDRVKDMQVAQLEERGMSDEQIEQAMQMSEKFMGPEMMVVWSVLGTLFFGFLVSLVIAAITKNTKPEYE
ncbi:DUF4199 domain-containing protein [Adhaeribacter aquaticus]|uniref:DUF4199 domain-containing protein n=1 Tax=Adhaeribacter aquaticus TaxID=299567 RepID=UPI00041D60F8|nr:DUF4199 domain-containing protein [Adhaeribacter aquaticus]